MRKLTTTLVALVVLAIAAFLILATPDTDPDAMRAKYGGSTSLFASTADGMQVHYRDQGCRDCPAIVLIHGSNASLQTFEPLVAILSDRYRLISYDQPGHGLTGPHVRDDYSASGMFEAFDAVVTDLEIDSFVVAGNSMGGWVAWRYALENAASVSALILLNASGAPPPASAAEPALYLGARIMRNPVGRYLAQYITPRKVIEKSLLESVSDKSLATDAMIDRYWELLRFPGNRRAAGIRATTDREPDFGHRLTEIQMPTLILWGAEDHVVPLYNAKTFAEKIPNSQLKVFEGVGHVTMEEVPEKTAAAFHDFLSAQISPRSSH